MARLRRGWRFGSLLATTVIIGASTLGVVAAPSDSADALAVPVSLTRQAEFAQAAAEFGTPLDVLLAVSYNLTRWEGHRGAPSTTGAYGPMALVDAPEADLSGKDAAGYPTVSAAAQLLGAPQRAVKADEATNIRGGAALLASYIRRQGSWQDAVADYAGSLQAASRREFVHDVYATLRSGASRQTTDGQQLQLPADPNVVVPAAPASPTVDATSARTGLPECPADITCNYVPAAYAQTDSNPAHYGNYDLADRPHNLGINYIVIHDTEESYDDTISTFQNPNAAISAHYLVRGSDGLVTQLVPTRDVAWQAGNWYVNMHSVGIEQVGFAIQGATWFTETLYRTTAALVRYTAHRFGIPLDRQHILGHDNVPGPTPANIPGMHWDPGPFWDWGHFMDLVGARRAVPAPGAHAVTISPRFATNIQGVTDCENQTQVAPQPANFVYLHTAPSASAPLFDDLGLDPAGTQGTTCAADWGDKAMGGQQFAVAGRSGEWTAIWWDGAKVWFQDPAAGRAATPTHTLVVTPKHGRASIPTYGRAYPDAADYPPTVAPQAVVPLPYTIAAGQAYVLAGPVPTDYYNSNLFNSTAPGQRVDVVGAHRYLQIQLGHRIGFVNADNVDVRPA